MALHLLVYPAKRYPNTFGSQLHAREEPGLFGHHVVEQYWLAISSLLFHLQNGRSPGSIKIFGWS